MTKTPRAKTTTTSKTANRSSVTAVPDTLQDLITAFLFEGTHGDELVLTKSGRLKIVVEAQLVVDGNSFPVRQLASTNWPRGESLAERLHTYAETWSSRVGDPLIIS